jgi:hypothetical protein
MAAETRRTHISGGPAVRRAVGEGRTLAAAMPRLDPGSAAGRGQCDPRPARPPPRRTGREFSGNTAASFPASRHRASTGGARRATIIFMCASRNGKPRTRCGSGPTARRRCILLPRWCATPSSTARWSCRAGARRGSGRRRRARRHSRPDAPDRQPQRHRQDGAGDRARSQRAAEPAAEFRALPARRNRRAVRPVERDRRSAAPSRSFPAAARTVTWCRSSIRPRRLSPIGAASNSSSRKAAAASPPAAPKPGAPITRRACAPPRRNPRRDRPARLELLDPPHRPPGDRTSARLHARIGVETDARAARLAPRPSRGCRHDRRPAARLCRTAGADRAADAAGAVVAVAAGSAAPAPHRLPADAAAPSKSRPRRKPRRARRGG